MFALLVNTVCCGDALGGALVSRKHVLTLTGHWDFLCHEDAVRYFFVSIYVFFLFLQLIRGNGSCVEGVNSLFMYVNSKRLSYPWLVLFACVFFFF